MAILQPPTRPDNSNNNRAVFGVCLTLALLVFLVFGRALICGFAFDDDAYVAKNAIVQQGLTWKGFCWAWSYGQIGHWHPLTWLSHMLDCELYGLDAAGHHLTNLLFHAATVILLFLVLEQMTGSLWRSAFVAAMFAVHPLRVESVTWVAERKDVLSGCFFMLTLGAYLRYVRQPSRARYNLMVLCFALGLLSKNMIVTLPFVLLLLDYWPLKRIPDFSVHSLCMMAAEKVPLFILAAVSCMVTFLVPEKVSSFFQMPLGLRLENAVMSYVIYLQQMFYPSKLAVLYPNPSAYFPPWQVAGALALLLAVSATAWIFRKQSPWLIVGWLWYLGMMVPVIGIVQISYYARADRYTYLPQIGLYLAITWMMGDLAVFRQKARPLLAAGALAVIGILSVCSWKQIAHWRTDESLWERAVACTSGNYIAENNLAFDLVWENPAPASPDQISQAIELCQKSVAANPRYPEAHFNLGMLFTTQGRTNAAIEQYNLGLAVEPDNPKVHRKLAEIYFDRQQWDPAIEHYQEALKQLPGSANDHYQFALALECRRHFAAAIAQFQKVLELNPTDVAAQNDLAWILATCPDASVRNGPKAVEWAQQAAQLSANTSPQILDTLAAAYAEAGQFPEAVKTTKTAINLATAGKNQSLVNGLQTRLKFYESNLAYHEP